MALSSVASLARFPAALRPHVSLGPLREGGLDADILPSLSLPPRLPRQA